MPKKRSSGKSPAAPPRLPRRPAPKIRLSPVGADPEEGERRIVEWLRQFIPDEPVVEVPAKKTLRLAEAVDEIHRFIARLKGVDSEFVVSEDRLGAAATLPRLRITVDAVLARDRADRRWHLTMKVAVGGHSWSLPEANKLGRMLTGVAMFLDILAADFDDAEITDD